MQYQDLNGKVMNSRHFLAAAAVFATAVGLTGGMPAPLRAADAAISADDAAGIVFERQNLMLQLEKDAELLGEIAAGLKPKDQLGEVTRSIAEGAAASKAAFEPRVPGGRSRPDVWSNWADYSKRLDDFDRNAATLAALGAKGDLTGVTNILGDALACKGCHDVYRAPKKPA